MAAVWALVWLCLLPCMLGSFEASLLHGGARGRRLSRCSAAAASSGAPRLAHGLPSKACWQGARALGEPGRFRRRTFDTIMGGGGTAAGSGGVAPEVLGARKRLLAITVQLQRLPPTATTAQFGQLLGESPLGASNMTTLLVHLKRRQRWRQAVTLLEYARQQPEQILATTHYNLVISACSRNAPRRALDLFHRMRDKQELPYDGVSYNAAMSAASQAGELELVLQLLDDLIAEPNMEATTISYNIAITACSKNRDWQNALLLFRRMEMQGVDRNTITYTAAIQACAECGQVDKALTLFNYMEVAAVARSPVTYAVAISGCTRCGEWEQGLQIFNDLVANGVEPDTVIYNAAISACEKGQLVDQALSLLEEMESRGLRLSQVTFGSAIAACEKGGRFQEAVDLLQRMDRTRGVKRNVLAYSSAISACGKAGTWQKAIELLREMEAYHVEPNTITYNAAIQACERASQWQEAIALFEEMKARNLPADTITYNALVRACERGGQWQLAFDYMKQMPTEERTADSSVFE